MPHNRELDGLRGLAALSVVVHHFFAAFLPATLYRHYPALFPEPVPGSLEAGLSFPLFSVLYSGLLPVDIFFVLSGLVLALPHWSGNRTLLLRRFWTRYIRLNIPVAAAILISFSVWWLGLYFNELGIPGIPVRTGLLSGSSRRRRTISIWEDNSCGEEFLAIRSSTTRRSGRWV